jgi:hypothetical protein
MAKKNKYGGLDTFLTTKKEVDKFSEPISTGSLILDLFLDGGYRVGLNRFYGPSEHGKTAQCLVWAKEWLKKFGKKTEIHYFDAEGRITKNKISTSGLMDVKDFVWAETMEEEDATFFHYTFNIYDHIGDFIFDKVRANKELPEEERKRFFIVIDSLDQLITSKDYEKSFSDPEKVGAAPTISALLSKKVGIFMAKYGHHIHVLSQVRANINMNNPNSPTQKVSGGNAMLHASVLTGQIKKDWTGTLLFENPKGKTLAEKGDVVGRLHTIKFEKTFNEKTHREVKIPIKFGVGVWREREIVDLLFVAGMASSGGSWITLNPVFVSELNQEYDVDLPEKIQGYQKLVDLVTNNKKLCEAFEDKLREVLLNFSGEEADKNDPNEA